MCMNLYRHIDRSKVQFDFVKHSPGKGAFEDEIISLGGQIYEAPRYRVYNQLSYERWWRRHLKAHPEHQIIHGHFFSHSAVYFRVARQFGRTTIGHVHMAPASHKNISFTRRMKLAIVEQTERYSDICLACSEESGKWLFPNKGFTVLRNGLDCNQFRFDQAIRKEMRSSFGLGNSLTLGTVANLSPVKNPMGLLDILEEVLCLRSDTKLLWVGEGPMRESIEARIHADGIEDSVILLGSRGDVSCLLQAMDIFLLPSFSEGLPMSLIEAQAAGLPCYVSNSVTHEVDITGMCNFLDINDRKQWAERIINNTDCRKDTSYYVMDAGYDIHETATWIQDLYLSIVAGNYKYQDR